MEDQLQRMKDWIRNASALAYVIPRLLMCGSRPFHGHLIMVMSSQLEVVQRLIITRHREFFDESPSPMKLQKLCYYAQGYLLAQGHELFPEDFQAWQHGPVIPSLYQRYRDFGWRSISGDVSFNEAEVSTHQNEEVSDIVAAYGRYDGAALSTMTHREAPWKDARGDLPESESSTALMPKDSLRTFFATKLVTDGQ